MEKFEIRASAEILPQDFIMNTWLYSPDRIGLVYSSNNPTCLKTLFQTRSWVLKDRMLYKLNCNYESNQSIEDKETKTEICWYKVKSFGIKTRTKVVVLTAAPIIELMELY